MGEKILAGIGENAGVVDIGDGNAVTVNGDVTVTDSLTSLFTCTSKAKAKDLKKHDRY